MIINWLVFSDLHFQFDNFPTKIVRQRLVDFVKETQPADFVIITGDCFHKGQKDMNIEDAADYIHRLTSGSGCGRSIYITPGNHDLVRTELRLSALNFYTS